MLQGWLLFCASAAATVATVVLARRQPLAWFALGALFFVLQLPELGVAAWVGGVVVLVYRISNPQADTGDDESR